MRKKLILLFGAALFLNVVGATVLTIGIKNKKQENSRSENLSEQNNWIIDRNFNLGIFNNSETKIVKNNIKRNINNQWYQTALIEKYKDKFKYPGFNYNYETGNNRYQTINNEKIDSMTLCYEERVKYVDDSKKEYTVKYSDPNFILNEIKHNQLKKHPAAKNFHAKQVSDRTKAIDKYFSIPSALNGPTSLGLYAVAGEEVILKFTEETLQKMKNQKIDNASIVINSSYWDNKAPGDSGQISNRYPFVQTKFTMKINDLIRNNGEFKFGSPFGGTISFYIGSKLKSNSYNVFYPSYDNFKFNIIGAVEMISYHHLLTSEQDWNNQIKNYLNNEITAPALSIDFAFGSANVQLTDINKFGHRNISDLKYPRDAMQKWFDFLFLSEYFASRDEFDSAKKIDFKFCDDIWGGVSAWGGGNILYAPTYSAINSFLSGDAFDIGSNWLLFHEVNHSFQQNSALFQKISHPKTNEVTMFNLSLISDIGRYRSLYNTTSEFNINGWRRLQNMFSTIDYIIKDVKYGSLGDSEYELQNLILYTLGSYNFSNYVRYDIVNAPSTKGLTQIDELSKYFKINFWHCLQNFYPMWNDGWPESYEKATASEKIIIDNLNQKYKSFDFVANIFASGPYLYNSEQDKFNYTNDMQVAYEIPAGIDYTFDFEKGINSANKNFKWKSLEFNNKTKLGGGLKLDPTNSKKLIYTPNKNKLNEIDEFDISIIPDEFVGKPNNYVSKYMWKIKVRQVVNSPTITLYKDYFASGDMEYDIEYMNKASNILSIESSDPRKGILQVQESRNFKNEIHKEKISFKFVVPKTGYYDFKIKYNGYVYVTSSKDSQERFATLKHSSSSYWNLINKKMYLEENELVDFNFYVTSTWNSSWIEFLAVLKNDIKEEFDIFNHCISPYANLISNNPIELLDLKKYGYKKRKINYNDFQTKLLGVNTSRSANIISKDKYTFFDIKDNYGSIDSDLDKKLRECDNYYFEHWGSVLPHEEKFFVEFKEKTKLRTIIFQHRTDNWYTGRATWVQIRNENNQVIYEGKYPNVRPTEFLELDKDYEVQRLNFYFKNTRKETIIFDAIKFSNQKYLKVNRIIPINDKNLNISSNWKIINNNANNGENISPVNNLSIKSQIINDEISFNLYCIGFDILGQLNKDNSNFDLFINNKLVKNVKTYSPNRKDNSILFDYTTQNYQPEKMNIRIVNKSNKPLYINYIQTYGDNVYLEEN